VQQSTKVELDENSHGARHSKLPFALAHSAAAITRKASDAPGYPPEDTLFPFGFGLTY
jgi:beta-glucosidase